MWDMASFFRSSYVRNNTLSGLFLLCFQYPNTWSQIGPNALTPSQNILRAPSYEVALTSPRLWVPILSTKCQREMNWSSGFLQIYTIQQLESLNECGNEYDAWVAKILGLGRPSRLIEFWSFSKRWDLQQTTNVRGLEVCRGVCTGA